MHAAHPSSQDLGRGKQQSQFQAWLPSEFEPSLGCTRTYLRKTKKDHRFIPRVSSESMAAGELRTSE